MRAAKTWGVTQNDIFVTILLKVLSPLAERRRAEPARRELAVASIVNIRRDFGSDAQNAFGPLLASFRISHPAPDEISIEQLAGEVHREIGTIRQGKLYLQTLLGLGLVALEWRFLSDRHRKEFFAKHYAVWAGTTPLNVAPLWALAGGRGAAPEYLRAVSTGPLAPMVCAISTTDEARQRRDHLSHRGFRPEHGRRSRCGYAFPHQESLTKHRLTEVDLAELEFGIPRTRDAASVALARIMAAVGAATLVAACATAPVSSIKPVPSDPLPPGAVLRSVSLEPGVEDRILALDPERISDEDVRSTLAKGPTPRMILLHGGIYPVELVMKNFAIFLQRMGYPAEKVRDPADGAYSQSPYSSSDRLTGEIAWFYEHEGVRPMMVGHSQGGMQAVKVLYELEGAFGDKVAVWNPVSDAPEDRFTITDPLTGNTRPVIGVSVAYVSAVGAGGAAFALPNQWNMAHRLRTIPATVDEFTGYLIPGDLIAWTLINDPGASSYRHEGCGQSAQCHLADVVQSHHGTSHVFPGEGSRCTRMDQRLPSEGRAVTKCSSLPPESRGENILWAADVWFSVKKHWCLEAQHLIRARRAALAVR